jgi:rubrerythrin
MNIFRTFEEIIDYAIDKEMDEIEFYSEFSKSLDKKSLQGDFWDIALGKTERMFCLEKMKDVNSDLNLGDMSSVSVCLDAEPIKKDLSDQDALFVAMNKEKAKFKFYFDMAEKATNKECKEILMRLADEEARQKLKFELEYDAHV